MSITVTSNQIIRATAFKPKMQQAPVSVGHYATWTYPRDVGMVAWWQSDSLTALYSSGDPITRWPDYSGNGNDLISPPYGVFDKSYLGVDLEGFRQPSYNISGGVTRASFSLSTGMWLPQTYTDSAIYDSPCHVLEQPKGVSVFGVYASTAAVDSDMSHPTAFQGIVHGFSPIPILGDLPIIGPCLGYHQLFMLHHGVIGGGSAGAAITPGTYVYLSMCSNAAKTTVRVSGTTTYSGASVFPSTWNPVVGANPLAIGGDLLEDPETSQRFGFQGSLKELIIYSRCLTGSETLDVESYLVQKHGL